MAKKIGQQINELHMHLQNLIRQIDEIEQQINHPDRPAGERRLLRARWNKVLSGTRFDPKLNAPAKKQTSKSSQSVLSTALYLKAQSKLFAVAGRTDDAERLLADAAALEAKGRALRRSGL